MIKRKYFVRAKINHNNNTGMYSWWSGIMCIPSWFELDADEIFNSAMSLSHAMITKKMERTTHTDEVEIEAINRI